MQVSSKKSNKPGIIEKMIKCNSPKSPETSICQIMLSCFHHLQQKVEGKREKQYRHGGKKQDGFIGFHHSQVKRQRRRGTPCRHGFKRARQYMISSRVEQQNRITRPIPNWWNKGIGDVITTSNTFQIERYLLENSSILLPQRSQLPPLAIKLSIFKRNTGMTQEIHYETCTKNQL